MTIAQLLAQHVVRGWEDRWPLVTVICMCGSETSADDHRGINRHLAVEEIHARHQVDVIVIDVVREAQARAYDKGYGHGRYDGENHPPYNLYRRPRPQKSRRNPYRRPLKHQDKNNRKLI